LPTNIINFMKKYMPPNKTILVFIGTYLPGNKAGGPIRSVANVVESLGDEFNFKIITADHDLGQAQPYPGIVPDTWCRFGKAEVYYASKKSFSLRALIKLLNSMDYDVLYLNSLFCLNFTIKPLLLRYLKLIPNITTILAPRGMFSPGALRLKWLKKRVYIFIVRFIGLYSNIIWQASSRFEEIDIRHVFGGTGHQMKDPVIVAPDLVGYQMDHSPYPLRIKKQGTLDIVFLSRISPMKNLDAALAMLKGIQGDINFNIFGPIEDQKYFQICHKICEGLDSNIKVTFHGEVDHAGVQGVLSSNHLFFLPTLGENFGHVILEALLAGCPVLISDKTQWKDLENLGIGWDIPLNSPDKFKAILKRFVEMDNEEFIVFSKRAANFGKTQLNNSTILEQNRELFRSALKISKN